MATQRLSAPVGEPVQPMPFPAAEVRGAGRQHLAQKSNAVPFQRRGGPRDVVRINPNVAENWLGCGVEGVQDMQHTFFEFLAGTEC